MYCLYVDFRKAVNQINHITLFQALEHKCIHIIFLKVLKSMYCYLNSCVKTRAGISGFFPYTIATRHGDKSSSTIFDLFMDELSSLLRVNFGTGIFITEDIPDILCLMFADDVANCAETVVKLQHVLYKNWNGNQLR